MSADQQHEGDEDDGGGVDHLRAGGPGHLARARSAPRGRTGRSRPEDGRSRPARTGRRGRGGGAPGRAASRRPPSGLGAAACASSLGSRLRTPFDGHMSRAGGTRTPNRRFWRPVLYQLSYCPSGARAPVTARAAKAAGSTRRYHRPRAGLPTATGLGRDLSGGTPGIPAARRAQRVSLWRVCWRSQRQYLRHLDALPVVLLVLRGDVVPALADLAGQGDLDPLLVLRHGLSSRRSRAAAVLGLVAAAGLEPATPRL